MGCTHAYDAKKTSPQRVWKNNQKILLSSYTTEIIVVREG